MFQDNGNYDQMQTNITRNNPFGNLQFMVKISSMQDTEKLNLKLTLYTVSLHMPYKSK